MINTSTSISIGLIVTGVIILTISLFQRSATTNVLNGLDDTNELILNSTTSPLETYKKMCYDFNTHSIIKCKTVEEDISTYFDINRVINCDNGYHILNSTYLDRQSCDIKFVYDYKTLYTIGFIVNDTKIKTREYEFLCKYYDNDCVNEAKNNMTLTKIFYNRDNPYEYYSNEPINDRVIKQTISILIVLSLIYISTGLIIAATYGIKKCRTNRNSNQEPFLSYANV